MGLIEGGPERWHDISVNKSSIQLLDTIVNELGGASKADYNGFVIFKCKLNL